MEARVWSDPQVLEMLRNDYVILAMYCDDKKKADESDWITVGNRTLKDIGKINSHIATTQYGVNAQPCYVLEGRNGELLAEPRSYDLDVDACFYHEKFNKNVPLLYVCNRHGSTFLFLY